MQGNSSFQSTNRISPRQGNDRLDSWKEIACFFGREVRTVQLWEKSEALPIWRHQHRKLGSVYAYRTELEAWWRASCRQGSHAGQPLPSSATRSVASPYTIPAALPDKPIRIAIAPFTCLEISSHAGQTAHLAGAFARGIAEELMFEFRGMNVQTTALFMGVDPDANSLRKLSFDLDVAALLTGSIRVAADRVRISTHLLCSETWSCLWSQRFDVALGNSLDTQAAIASRIAASIPLPTIKALSLNPRDIKARSDAAHSACMVGRYFWEQRNNGALHKAAQFFNSAIELDPRCDEAYAGLADCHVSFSFSNMVPAAEASRYATSAANSLVQLGRRSVAQHNCLSNLHLNFDWDWRAACRETSLGCDYDSANGRALQLRSIFFATQSRHDEAIELALKAHHADPTSKVFNNEVGFAYYYSREYAKALSYVQTGLDMDPEYMMGYVLLGMTQSAQGNWQRAQQAFLTAVELSGGAPFARAHLAYVHASIGDTSTAVNILNQLEESSGANFPAFNIAAVHLALNDKAAARARLRQAFLARDIQVVCLKSDPRFTVLYTDSEFRDIVSATGL